MPRLLRLLTTLTVAITFTVVVTAVQPQPVYANTDTETILIVLGAVFGGLAIIAIVATLLVRNNPAWMPAAPGLDVKHLARDERPPGVRFGLDCGWRPGGMPLLCWN
ncbi:MAG: hypothetical protein SF182_05720 [Deltaproteobacteria bacterium]|nr:hypothetical protein [Deltaproteobacteria bacterium]